MLAVRRWSNAGQRLLLCNLGAAPATPTAVPGRCWQRSWRRVTPQVLFATSEAARDLTTLPAHSAVLLG